MKLVGKKAIVTGANRSIGKGIALAFAREGADVVISYRSDEQGAKDVVAEITAMGCSAKALYGDFSEPEGVKEFFEEAVEFLGSVDILVNNAAGYDTTRFLDADVRTFKSLLDVGVAAPMYLTQLVAKQMVEKGIAGAVVNVSSISGLRPYPNRVAHSTAKAALNMLTQVCALELAPHNIRVNAIAPGTTPYEMPAEGPSHKDIPLGRYGTPEDQAKAVVFLASNDASWTTGQIITSDGGSALSF